MNLEVIDLILLGIIVGLEVLYVVRDYFRNRSETVTQNKQLELLQALHNVLVEQREVLIDSQAELADMRDEMVEEPNESNQDRNDQRPQVS